MNVHHKDALPKRGISGLVFLVAVEVGKVIISNLKSFTLVELVVLVGGERLQIGNDQFKPPLFLPLANQNEKL